MAMDATVPSATAISFFIRSSQNLARTMKPENVIDFNGHFQGILCGFVFRRREDQGDNGKRRARAE
jgi:hypothetical protein